MSRWFRHYAGMARDDKLVRAAIKSGQPVERVVWLWAAILESAAEIDDGGRYDLDTAEAAYFLRASTDDLDAIVAALAACGRVADGCVVKWGDRQFQSDRSAERQKRHREKQKAGGDAGGDDETNSMARHGDDGVTSLSRHSDAPETETDTEADKKEEPTPPTSGGGAFRIETPARAPKPPYPEEFEALWRSYSPVASPNSTKADAHKAWAKLDEPTKAQCAEGLALYVAWLREEKQRRDGTKVKHLETFISKRGWEPFTERQPSAAATTVWVTDDDPRWPVAADRWRAEKGRPPPVVGGSQGNTGQGWHFPTDWLEPRAH